MIGVGARVREGALHHGLLVELGDGQDVDGDPDGQPAAAAAGRAAGVARADGAVVVAEQAVDGLRQLALAAAPADILREWKCSVRSATFASILVFFFALGEGIFFWTLGASPPSPPAPRPCVFASVRALKKEAPFRNHMPCHCF